MSANDLLAQCVEANVRAAAHTTNALITSYQGQLRDLADAYTRLYDGLTIIPDVQRTVYIERLLEGGDATRYACDRLLVKDVTT